jgi:hypothetical protein
LSLNADRNHSPLCGVCIVEINKWARCWGFVWAPSESHNGPSLANAADTASSAPRRCGSFEEFFHAFEGELFGYLWRMTGDGQKASDLCQETLLRVRQHFAKVSSYERPAA